MSAIKDAVVDPSFLLPRLLRVTINRVILTTKRKIIQGQFIQNGNRFSFIGINRFIAE